MVLTLVPISQTFTSPRIREYTSRIAPSWELSRSAGAKEGNGMSKIDTAAFEKRVEGEGYTVVRRELGPAEGLDDHTHDFDAWGLVTAGEFRVTVDGKTTVYGAGDEFKLEAGCLHAEAAGPSGAALTAGRRMKS